MQGWGWRLGRQCQPAGGQQRYTQRGRRTYTAHGSAAAGKSAMSVSTTKLQREASLRTPVVATAGDAGVCRVQLCVAVVRSAGSLRSPRTRGVRR